VRTAIVWALGFVLAAAGPATANAPELPRGRVDIRPVPVAGRSIAVHAGGDVQAALDAAAPGDEIVLPAGARFKGSFRLPRKPGTGWITVRSSAADALRPGTRVRPTDATSMAALVAGGAEPVLRTAPGAHHWRLVGLELAVEDGGPRPALVALGDDEKDAGSLPHHLILDRCWIHGDRESGGRRGVAVNAGHVAIVDSYLSDWKGAGVETQAVAGWNGPGPLAVLNSYLEGSGMGLLLGGADPSIDGLVATDVEIRGNHFSRPAAWNPHAPGFRGRRWSVKNLLELKSARRVLIEGNLFEHNWADAQSGFAIVFTVRNQDGRAPWSVVEDVTFRGNVVRDTAGGVSILGRDDTHPSGPSRRILIADNLFDGVGGPQRGGGGRLFQVLAGPADVVIDHNTAVNTGNVITAAGAPARGFVFTNNIAVHNDHGIIGDGAGVGTPTLQTYFPGARVARNALVGGHGPYPGDTFFPRSLDAVRFVNRAAGDYALAPDSPYRRKGTDGRDLGAAMENLAAARAAASGHAAGATPSGRVLAGAGDGAAEVVFWLCVAVLGYVYAGYPALVTLAARLRPRPVIRRPIEPSVSVLIVAHDEAERIAARLQNLLALDYPPERLEILVGSDGSTDDTAVRARTWEAKGVRVTACARRRGKPAVLNELAAQARGEILVLGDVRQRWAREALRALVAPFADPTVGAVSGELVLTDDDDATAVGTGVGAYWRYEKAIRVAESRLDSTVGATGAIYAVRRALFEPVPVDTILDDVLIPLRVACRGYRVVFESSALAFDRPASAATEEFTRKVRTIAGNFQLFTRHWRWVLCPGRNRLLVQTMSHKVLRLASPLFLLGAFVSNALLLARWPYAVLLGIQLAFYAAAARGATLPAGAVRPAWVAVPYVFCLLNDATLVAFARFVRGRVRVTWERAA
jgi:GT2 family glycosyltransferase